ncbi:MAG: hypothetical protein QOF65_2978, partial [Thermoleophilaceae bacterium]|nr:hypothetical protein [Thermoleophilaceae bacterium]
MAVQDTARTSLGEATLTELAESLSGEMICPGDPSYDEARAIWNGAHDARPAVIVRCAGASDVIRAIEFARSEDLVVAVRGGGHSIPGFSTCDGGIVIDLSPMKGIRVDPGRRTVVAQAGCLWSDLDHETQAFGLALTGGLIGTTGIAGFTLGGGIGWLMRTCGLTCDSLIGADVVTADGRLVHASADENAELFWGLRGGGGNFGVVTAFEYQLHPVGPLVLGGPIFYRGEDAEQVLEGYRELAAGFPDELTTLVNLATAPPAPFLPEEIHGKPIIAIVACWNGPHAVGEQVLAPLRSLAEPVADLCGPIPYVTLQTLLDPLYAKGAQNYFKAGFFDALDDETVATLLEGHRAMPGPQCELHIHHMGGAVARVGAGDTAFGNREA